MTHPWHTALLAGAHGLRRIPGQYLNLAHLHWRTPCAPAPLPFSKGQKPNPRRFFLAGIVVFLPSLPLGGARGEELLSGRSLPQALPGQRPCSSVGAQDGASRGTLRVSTQSINPLTHQLAPKKSLNGFKASTAWLEPFLSERRLQRVTKAPDVAGMLDDLFW